MEEGGRPGAGAPAGAAAPLTLFTAGYQGRALDELVEELARRGVRCLVDVRYNPWSRRPGFGGRALAAALRARGLLYVHLQDLGAPPPLRQAYAGDGDAARFAAGYRRHLAQCPDALEQLRQAVEAHGRVCLLCRERDPADCHRLLVAEELAGRVAGLSVEHIL